VRAGLDHLCKKERKEIRLQTMKVEE